jgi:glycyl-radical enzyme activating protein
MTGLVFDIQRFCTHDGPGIRTTVFLKGCPLRCLWCHNPESQSRVPEILFSQNLCIDCKSCENACPEHDARNILLSMNRAVCSDCFKCAQICPSGAIKLAGQKMSADQVIEEVLKDNDYYEISNGGMTISGGEPFAQFDYTLALAQKAKIHKLHVCIETSGFIKPENIEKLVPYIDLWLWDIKDTDPERYFQNTGVKLSASLENLKLLDSLSAKTILRCIILRGINAETSHYEKIAGIYDQLKNCLGVELIPYHPLGNSKLQQLGQTELQIDYTPSVDQFAQARSILANRLYRAC